MSKVGELVSGVVKALRGFGIKAPWRYTGPVSSPEYLSHLPKATEYRAVAPASQAIRVAVPHAEPEYVYDIKYYVRDSRRNESAGGSRVLARSEFDPKATEESSEPEVVPPTPDKPYKWSTKLRPILDNDNNGYTL